MSTGALHISLTIVLCSTPLFSSRSNVLKTLIKIRSFYFDPTVRKDLRLMQLAGCFIYVRSIHTQLIRNLGRLTILRIPGVTEVKRGDNEFNQSNVTQQHNVVPREYIHRQHLQHTFTTNANIQAHWGPHIRVLMWSRKGRDMNGYT